MTPQDKIDEIYNILQKYDRRESRKRIFRWLIRIVSFIVILLLILYPGVIVRLLTNFFYPIIQENIKQIIVEQKNTLFDEIDYKIKNISRSLNN